MKKIKIILISLLASFTLFGVTGTSSAYDTLGTNSLKESNLRLFTGSNPGYSDLSYGTSINSLLLETEYNTSLPWMDETRLKVKFVIDPNLWSRPGSENSRIDSQAYWLNYSSLADTNFLNSNPGSFDTSFNTDDLGYGLQISTLFYGSSVGLYFWAGSENSLLTPLSISGSTSPFQLLGGTSAFNLDNTDYYFRNKNIAAAWSKDLSFLGFIHQGNAPTIRLETSYRSDEIRAVYAAPGTANHSGGYDELSVGFAYEGKNNFELLNSSYGINWGFGYSYSRTLSIPEIVVADTGLENFDTSLGTHSGNINATTSWKNMRLMTMVMYLYDIQSKGGVTMMQANFSPDLRWTYGVRANFYDGAESPLWPWIKESEQISLSVTYKW